MEAPQSHSNPQKKSKRWLKSFQYDENNDSATDTRNVLLIVAALITAVTFQAGVNPPGGVWQETKDNHTAGRAIYAEHKEPFYVFLVSNTLAFSACIMVIMSLTYKFPLHFELWAAMLSMVVTYGSAVFAVTPDESVKFRWVLFSAAVPFLFRLLWEIYYMIDFKICCLFRK